MPTDIFYNGIFAPGAGCRANCIVSNTWIYHNKTTSFIHINLGSKDVSSYSMLNIYGAINSYPSTSTLSLANVAGICNMVTISAQGNVWSVWSIDISQLTAFNLDSYLSIGGITGGEYPDMNAHTRISHIWLS
ncbi:MAG: hypothetical protein KH230_20355 [Enterocloster asparagiformis]|nr:hypothetical protein [Enterocloster asparagiformis]